LSQLLSPVQLYSPCRRQADRSDRNLLVLRRRQSVGPSGSNDHHVCVDVRQRRQAYERNHQRSDTAVNRTESYTFDIIGNRVAETIDLPSDVQVISSTYDVNDRLLQQTVADNGTVDQRTTYDWGITSGNPVGVTEQLGDTVTTAAGTLISRQALSYSDQGELASAVNESYDASGALTERTRVSYQYDAEGLRILATDATDTTLNGTFATEGLTQYLFDPHNLTGLAQALVETHENAAGQAIERVTYSFGLQQITQTTTQLDPSSANVSSQTVTFLQDGNGSVRALVGAAEKIVQTFAYAAYGDLLAIHDATGAFVSSSATDALTSHLYAGQSFDIQSDRVFLRARWYSPNTGRFDRVDPFGGDPSEPLSFNKYAYTSGDPIDFGDPTGRFEGLVGVLAGFGISTGGRTSWAGASLAVLNSAQRALSVVQFIEDVVVGYYTGGLWGIVHALIGVDPAEFANLGRTLATARLTNLGASSLAAGIIVPVTIGLPRGRSGIGKALRLVSRILGKSNSVQEFLGEIATRMLAGLMNFKSLNLPWFPTVVGPDFFLRQKNTGIYGMFEAKGGTSRLSRRMTRYGRQMDWRWIDHWYRELGTRNPRGDGPAILAAHTSGDPLVAVVASLNLQRRNQELKMAVQLWTANPASWRNWVGF
jgi:RHS repeat-associated protein